ncbi:MAG: Holliday junction resolvase RuvX [Planctomycetota bacterium]|jgi:putative Holliday junction resolvase
MRYLAIDYGNKRTGLAVCDASETITSPLTVINSNKNLIEKICQTVEKEDIKAIVLGLPLNMDNSKGPQARRTIAFSKELELQIDIPIHFQDERLSSFTAREKLAEAELTKKKKKKRLDAVAAAQILEAFLENKHSQEQEND